MATETSQPPISAGFQRMVGVGRLLFLPGAWGPGIWEFLWGVRTEGPSLQNPHLVAISSRFLTLTVIFPSSCLKEASLPPGNLPASSEPTILYSLSRGEMI